MNQFENGTKFVVLTSQRSGSTWLMSLLNQAKATRAYGELFLRRKKIELVKRWDELWNYPRFPEVCTSGRNLRPLFVFSYLDTLYHQSGSVGFKLMYSQLIMYPEIMAYIFLHRVRIVHLVRQNQLDVLISSAIKNKTKKAHFLAGDNIPENIQVELNPEKLLDRIKRKQNRVQTARRLLSCSMLPHLEINYEGLLSDSTSFQKICYFLRIEIENELLESKLVKIARKSTSEVVSNYKEVQNALAGTPYAVWIDH